MKKKPFYSKDFKWKVIREVIQGNITKEEARKCYGIGGKSTVLEWLREAAGQDGKGEIPSKEQQVIMQLREQLEQKERQLNYFQLKSEALERMIIIAEEKYGIAIRKKYGAKQPKK